MYNTNNNNIYIYIYNRLPPPRGAPGQTGYRLAGLLSLSLLLLSSLSLSLSLSSSSLFLVHYSKSYVLSIICDNFMCCLLYVLLLFGQIIL